MEITRDTKLKDILAAYPDVKERLSEINPKFGMINSPMGKIMISKVSIADMSNRSGMDVDEIINKLKLRT